MAINSPEHYTFSESLHHVNDVFETFHIKELLLHIEPKLHPLFKSRYYKDMIEGEYLASNNGLQYALKDFAPLLCVAIQLLFDYFSQSHLKAILSL